MRKTKRITSRDKDIDFQKIYGLEDAFQLLKDRSGVKFDETVDVVINSNLDPRKADQNLRGAVSLPHGTGKTVRVAVFAEGASAQEAKAAGADVVGYQDLIEEVLAGRLDFDFCIAVPQVMAELGKRGVGKILGPRGLMPNPKLGTVTEKVGDAVGLAKAGQVVFRTDKAGVIHGVLGKLSFSSQDLKENFRVFYNEIAKMRPASLKGMFLEAIYVSSTMGFSLKVSPLEKE